MKRALRLTMAALAAAFAALLVVAAVAGWNGMLTRQRVSLALRALRGEPMPPAAAGEQKTSKDLAARYAAEALAQRQLAVEDLKAQEEALALEVNARRADLARIDGDLARLRKVAADRVEALVKAEKAFADARSAQEKLVRSAAFRREVETFENMRERDAARHLYGYENALAVELLKAFKADFRAKVVTEIDKLDRLSENAKREPKAPALLKLLWPGDANVTALGGR
jgi:hypothetical protein